jgi:hypothetical protein
LKREKTTAVNKPFFYAKIGVTNIGSIRIIGIVLSHVPTRFAFLFAICYHTITTAESFSNPNQPKRMGWRISLTKWTDSL